MTSDGSQHLHLLFRDKNGHISGAMQPKTPAAIEALLNGTPYRDDLALWDVVTGKVERAYHVSKLGWVAITRCSGTHDGECAEVGVSLVVGGDIRFGKQLGAL